MAAKGKKKKKSGPEPGEKKARSTKTEPPFDPGYFAIVCVCIMYWIAFVGLGTFKPQEQVVGGVDPVGYFAWAHSIAFDWDIDFANEYRAFHRGPADDDSYLTIGGAETELGRVGNVFAMGPGLCWIPFLMMARLFTDDATGFGQTYFSAIFYANMFYSWIGVLLIFGALRRWFEPGRALIATLAAWTCSPALYYAYGQVAMSHACSFFGVALALYVWARLRESDEWWKWLLIGMAVGIATIIRWQNITFAAVVAVDVLARRDWKHWPKAVASAAGAIIAFSPQSIAWYRLYGSFFTIPQGSGFMQWTNLDPWTPLFSLKYGLITWTPFCAVGIVGMFLLPKEKRLVFVALLTAFLLQFYVQFATGDAGWSFSMRRMCNLVPFFAVGTALVALRFKLRSRWLLAIAAPFVIWNFLFVIQYGGIIDEFYIFRAMDALAAEHGLTRDQLAQVSVLPDGTPFNIVQFAEENRFPRGFPPTWTQVIFDKVYVVREIGMRLLTIGT